MQIKASRFRADSFENQRVRDNKNPLDDHGLRIPAILSFGITQLILSSALVFSFLLIHLLSRFVSSSSEISFRETGALNAPSVSEQEILPFLDWSIDRSIDRARAQSSSFDYIARMTGARIQRVADYQLLLLSMDSLACLIAIRGSPDPPRSRSILLASNPSRTINSLRVTSQQTR